MARFKPKKRWIEYCRRRAAESEKFRVDKKILLALPKELNIDENLRKILLEGNETDILVYEDAHHDELSRLESILINLNRYKLERSKEGEEGALLGLVDDIKDDIQDIDINAIYDESTELTKFEGSVATNFDLIKTVNNSPEVSSDGKRAVQLRAIQEINKRCIQLSDSFSAENMKIANKRLLAVRAREFSKKAKMTITGILLGLGLTVGLISYGEHVKDEAKIDDIVLNSDALKDYYGNEKGLKTYGPYYDYLHAVEEGNTEEAKKIFKDNKKEVLAGIMGNIASQEAGFPGDIVDIEGSKSEQGFMSADGGNPYAGTPYMENTITATVMNPDGKTTEIEATRKSIIEVLDGSVKGYVYDGVTGEQYEILRELLENNSISLEDAQNALLALKARAEAKEAQEGEQSQEPDAGDLDDYGDLG